MKTIETKKPVTERPVEREAEAKAYEAPRITRKHSLERVTLASGTFTPGGQIGGN
jgi:hypothetical protein